MLSEMIMMTRRRSHDLRSQWLDLRQKNFIEEKWRFLQFTRQKNLTTHCCILGQVHYYESTDTSIYDVIQDTLDSIPNSDVKLLMGDLNAKI